MLIGDKKFTQEEIDRVSAPMELDLLAFFKVLEEQVLNVTAHDDQSPEQLINEISNLFGEEQ